MIYLYCSSVYAYLFECFLNNFKKNLNKKSILIIPEKYSFYAEKKIYENFNLCCKNLKILTFEKLAIEIFKKHGYVAGSFASKMDKILVLCNLILNLHKKLKIKKNLLYNSTFLNIILNDIENLKKNNITPKIFKKKIKKIKDINLKEKAKMLYEIFNIYDEKLKQNFKDPTENVKKACEISSNVNFFKNINVFFLFFIEFNETQIKLIETMVKQTNIKFFINFEKNEPLFNISKNTIDILKKISVKNNIKFKKEAIVNKISEKSEEMQKIEKNIFRVNKKNKIIKTNSKNFKIFKVQNKEEEVELVLSKILNIKKLGFKWSEIAVLSENLENYKSKLKINLKNFNIPYFMEENKTANNLKLIKTVRNILKIFTNFNIKSYLNILKCGLTKFNVEEISIFENYIKTYNINSNSITIPFEKIVSEYFNLTETSKEEIIIAEKLKKPIYKIFNIFKKNKNSSKNIAIKIIKTLKILGIYEKIENKMNYSNKKTNLKNEWNIIIEILEEIYKITKEKEITIKQFEFLFYNASKKIKTENFVPFSNSVFIGDFTKTIPTNPKITIIFGVEPDSFPSLNNNSYSLFSQNETYNLKKFKINFNKTFAENNYKITYQTFKAISSPTKKLYIFYSSNNKENLEQNNRTLNELKNLFLNGTVESCNKKEHLPEYITKKMAYKKLMLNFNEKTKEIYALKKYFKISEEKHKKNNKVKINFKEFFNGEISPSQIEQFFLCPFSYFCRYILKINETKTIELDNKFIGQIIHKILQKVISLENFLKLTKLEISKEIETILKNTIKSKIFLQENKKFKLLQIVESLNKNLTLFCYHVKNELNTIGFTPKYFEYYISKNSKIKPIKIKFNNSFTVSVKGTLDRIDIMKKNNTKYVRIVDYKFKNKNFNFAEFLKGLNLQIILYVLALEQSIKKIENVVFSGAFYITTVGNFKKYNTFKTTPKSSDIKKIFKKIFNVNGFLINSEENIEILEKVKTKEYDKYSPLKKTNNETFFKNAAEKTLISKNELEIIYKFIEEKIVKMCEKIKNFEFEKSPEIFPTTKEIYCNLCEFKNICKKENILKPKQYYSINKVEFFNILNKKLRSNNLNEK